ncbi:hypothetical protein NKI04_29105 [Mesorhizobium sp. M0814]|uniref:hypothetical protein n=1 Tax=Mesorhizobium sp. M0814 TaxID=2957004 RepID=UPI0033372B69
MSPIVVSLDRVENIFAGREGFDPDLKPVLTGSHFDTQIAGGKLDGFLECVRLELVRTLNDPGVEIKRPAGVVCVTNEEDVRSEPPMTGSGKSSGAYDMAGALEQTDDKGLVVGSSWHASAHVGERDRDPQEIDAHFELYFEQRDPFLFRKGCMSDSHWGFTWFGAEIELKAENARAGPTPMKDRKDALAGVECGFCAG